MLKDKNNSRNTIIKIKKIIYFFEFHIFFFHISEKKSIFAI